MKSKLLKILSFLLIIVSNNIMAIEYTPAWPHGMLEEVFHNVWMVKGTNKVAFDGINVQTSRNMVVLKNKDELILINTVRLTEPGLKELDKLGKVKHVISIGAFHGRDDAFYVDNYQAKLWQVQGKENQHGLKESEFFNTGSELPHPELVPFVYQSIKFSEAVLLLKQSDGILISCDSIQNVTAPDEYFNKETIAMFEKDNLFVGLNIPSTWVGACQPDFKEFDEILKLNFKHIITAHGKAVKDDAHQRLEKIVQLHR